MAASSIDTTLVEPDAKFSNKRLFNALTILNETADYIPFVGVGFSIPDALAQQQEVIFGLRPIHH